MHLRTSSVLQASTVKWSYNDANLNNTIYSLALYVQQIEMSSSESAPTSSKPSPLPRKRIQQQEPPAKPPRSPLLVQRVNETPASNEATLIHQTKTSRDNCPVRRSASLDDHSSLRLRKEPPLSRDLWRTMKKSDSPSSLATFVKTYQNDFPMSVEVTRGTQPGITAGAIYNFHFIKNTRVINFESPSGQFCIPLNSSVQIGIVYPPILNSENEICKNVVFNGAKEIMAAEPLPKILRAANAYVDSNPDFSIAQNELLIVKKVRKSRPFGQQSLLVYSLTNNVEKVLRENCNVLFMTTPENVMVYPVELFAHFYNALPLKAILQFDKNTGPGGDTPKPPSTKIVTLANHGVARSIIATPYRGKEQQQQEKVLEIPLDADIEVEKAMIADDEELCAEALTLIRDFDPKHVSLCAPAPKFNEGSIRQGYEKIGLELESVLLQSRRPEKLPAMEGAYSTPHDSLYAPLPAPEITQLKSDIAPIKSFGGRVEVEVQLNALQRTVEIMQSQMNTVEALARKNNIVVGLLKAEITTVTQQLTTRIDTLVAGQGAGSSLQVTAAAVQTPSVVVPPTPLISPLPDSADTLPDKEKNRNDLMQLNCKEVRNK